MDAEKDAAAGCAEEEETDPQLLRQFDSLRSDVTSSPGGGPGAGGEEDAQGGEEAAEALRRRVLALKKEAVLAKRAGRIDDARAKLREAKLLEIPV